MSVVVPGGASSVRLARESGEKGEAILASAAGLEYAGGNQKGDFMLPRIFSLALAITLSSCAAMEEDYEFKCATEIKATSKA